MSHSSHHSKMKRSSPAAHKGRIVWQEVPVCFFFVQYYIHLGVDHMRRVMCGQKEMLCKGLCARVPLQFAAKVGSGAGHESRQFFNFVRFHSLAAFESIP